MRITRASARDRRRRGAGVGEPAEARPQRLRRREIVEAPFAILPGSGSMV